MNDDMTIRIGNELKKLRIDLNMKPRDVQKETKIDINTIYKYERGEGNNFDTLERFLNFYKVPYYIFFKNIYDTKQNKNNSEKASQV